MSSDKEGSGKEMPEHEHDASLSVVKVRAVEATVKNISQEAVQQTMQSEESTVTPKQNHKLLKKLCVVAVLMFGFGYAMVPLYKKICELTGVNVLAFQESQETPAKNSQVDTSRLVTIEFDATARGPWTFKPAANMIQVHPGEIAHMVYEVHNPNNRSMDAQAIPSYAPNIAMGYFKKLECFCFKQQKLEAGSTRDMLVSFVIDPKLPKDVNTITLSYTFFEVGLNPAGSASPASNFDDKASSNQTKKAVQ